MVKELAGKVVIVTGGTRGIGRSIALEAVARGAKVAVCARAVDAGPALIAEAEKLGGAGCLSVHAADVSKEADVEALFDAVLERFEQVDVVVNNAGINRDALLPQTSLEDFQQVMAVNLTGAFLMSRRAIREFLAQGTGGQLVAIGSVSANGAASQAAYAASKGGLEGLTRTIAKEYGHKNVRANLVVVGYVQTELTHASAPELVKAVVEQTPLRRAGAAQEVAQAALYLAGPRATWVNGEVLYASGGLRELPR